MKKQTYAESQYKSACSLLRELRQLNYEHSTAEYIREVLSQQIESSYVEAAKVAIWLNYDYMPTDHPHIFWWQLAMKYDNAKALSMANQTEADWLKELALF